MMTQTTWTIYYLNDLQLGATTQDSIMGRQAQEVLGRRMYATRLLI